MTTGKVALNNAFSVKKLYTFYQLKQLIWSYEKSLLVACSLGRLVRQALRG